METLLELLKAAWLPLVLSAVTAYLLGSLDFAIIVTKIFANEDIREKGSGNAGATNVLRSHGKKLAALTTLGDLGKCIVSALLAKFVIFPLCGASAYAVYGAAAAGLCCVIGHMYPVFFGFRGGKGVLTVLGMMLVLDWRVALLGLAVFIVVVLISRMVSLGSVIAGVTIVISAYVDWKFIQNVGAFELAFCTTVIVIAIGMAIAKHAANIKRIINGTENKIGSKK